MRTDYTSSDIFVGSDLFNYSHISKKKFKIDRMEDWVGKGGGWDVYGQIGWYAQRNGNLTSLDHTDSKHGSKLVNRNFLGIFTYFKFCLFVYYKFIVLFKIEFKNSVNW